MDEQFFFRWVFESGETGTQSCDLESGRFIGANYV